MSEISAIGAIERLLVLTVALALAFAQCVEVLALAEAHRRPRFVPGGLDPGAQDVLLFLLCLLLLLLLLLLLSLSM